MFPQMFVDELLETFEAGFVGYNVIAVPITDISTTKSISVWAENWLPDEDSALIGTPEPAINYYNLRIQNLIVHADRVVGQQLFTYDARKLRAILYRDSGLRVALASMSEEVFGSVERFSSLRVKRQDLMPARQNLGFAFLAQTYLSIKTETSPA